MMVCQQPMMVWAEESGDYSYNAAAASTRHPRMVARPHRRSRSFTDLLPPRRMTTGNGLTTPSSGSQNSRPQYCNPTQRREACAHSPSMAPAPISPPFETSQQYRPIVRSASSSRHDHWQSTESSPVSVSSAAYAAGGTSPAHRGASIPRGPSQSVVGQQGAMPAAAAARPLGRVFGRSQSLACIADSDAALASASLMSPSPGRTVEMTTSRSPQNRGDGSLVARPAGPFPSSSHHQYNHQQQHHHQHLHHHQEQQQHNNHSHHLHDHPHGRQTSSRVVCSPGQSCSSLNTQRQQQLQLQQQQQQHVNAPVAGAVAPKYNHHSGGSSSHGGSSPHHLQQRRQFKHTVSFPGGNSNSVNPQVEPVTSQIERTSNSRGTFSQRLTVHGDENGNQHGYEDAGFSHENEHGYPVFYSHAAPVSVRLGAGGSSSEGSPEVERALHRRQTQPHMSSHSRSNSSWHAPQVTSPPQVPGATKGAFSRSLSQRRNQEAAAAAGAGSSVSPACQPSDLKNASQHHRASAALRNQSATAASMATPVRNQSAAAMMVTPVRNQSAAAMMATPVRTAGVQATAGSHSGRGGEKREAATGGGGAVREAAASAGGVGVGSGDGLAKKSLSLRRVASGATGGRRKARNGAREANKGDRDDWSDSDEEFLGLYSAVLGYRASAAAAGDGGGGRRGGNINHRLFPRGSHVDVSAWAHAAHLLNAIGWQKQALPVGGNAADSTCKGSSRNCCSSAASGNAGTQQCSCCCSSAGVNGKGDSSKGGSRRRRSNSFSFNSIRNSISSGLRNSFSNNPIDENSRAYSGNGASSKHAAENGNTHISTLRSPWALQEQSESLDTTSSCRSIPALGSSSNSRGIKEYASQHHTTSTSGGRLTSRIRRSISSSSAFAWTAGRGNDSGNRKAPIS